MLNQKLSCYVYERSEIIILVVRPKLLFLLIISNSMSSTYNSEVSISDQIIDHSEIVYTGESLETSTILSTEISSESSTEKSIELSTEISTETSIDMIYEQLFSFEDSEHHEHHDKIPHCQCDIQCNCQSDCNCSEYSDCDCSCSYKFDHYYQKLYSSNENTIFSSTLNSSPDQQPKSSNEDNNSTDSNKKYETYVAVLNGSGKLIEFGLIEDKNIINLENFKNANNQNSENTDNNNDNDNNNNNNDNDNDDKNYSNLNEIYDGIGPQMFNVPVCVKECNDFKMAEIPNYINGDLIIISDDSKMCSVFSSLGKTFMDCMQIFNNLIGINGSLYIVGTSYQKIAGFEKLEFILGDLIIVNNQKLTSIPIFPSLRIIGRNNLMDINFNVKGTGRIIISNNNLLEKIIGFEMIKQISKGIYIIDNPKLTDICGFINLSRTGDIIINNNNNLQNILGFCYIDFIRHHLSISCNNNTNTNKNLIIDAFHYLDNVGELMIRNNNGLQNLILKNLTKINKDLFILSNDTIKKINLIKLLSVGSIIIKDNPKLKKLYFKNLLEIIGSLLIIQNDSLTKLHNFDSLKRIDRSILIFSNPNLKIIRDFNNLIHLGSKVYQLESNMIKLSSNNFNNFTNQWNTDAFSGKCHQTGTTIFEIYSNPIINLPDTFKFDIDNGHFDKSFIDYYQKKNLEISENNQITNLPCYYNVSILIYNNPRLIKIEMAHKLKAIEGNIYIIKNVNLNLINGFDILEYILDLWIRNNPLIKTIKGFNSVIGARDIMIMETINLELLDNLQKLKRVQHIYLQSSNQNSIRLNKRLKSFAGILLYYNQ